MSTTPIRVAITGAAGQIGYSLLFRIASGAMFGPNQKVALNLIEIEPGMKALEGVVMELEDCAFPLLEDIVATSDLNTWLLTKLTGHYWSAVFHASKAWSVKICLVLTVRFSPDRAKRSLIMLRRMHAC